MHPRDARTLGDLCAIAAAQMPWLRRHPGERLDAVRPDGTAWTARSVHGVYVDQFGDPAACRGNPEPLDHDFGDTEMVLTLATAVHERMEADQMQQRAAGGSDTTKILLGVAGVAAAAGAVWYLLR